MLIPQQNSQQKLVRRHRLVSQRLICWIVWKIGNIVFIWNIRCRLINYIHRQCLSRLDLFHSLCLIHGHPLLWSENRFFGHRFSKCRSIWMNLCMNLLLHGIYRGFILTLIGARAAPGETLRTSFFIIPKMYRNYSYKQRISRCRWQTRECLSSELCVVKNSGSF